MAIGDGVGPHRIGSGGSRQIQGLAGDILRCVVVADIAGDFLDSQADLLHFGGNCRGIGQHVFDGCLGVRCEQFGRNAVAFHIALRKSDGACLSGSRPKSQPCDRVAGDFLLCVNHLPVFQTIANVKNRLQPPKTLKKAVCRKNFCMRKFQLQLILFTAVSACFLQKHNPFSPLPSRGKREVEFSIYLPSRGPNRANTRSLLICSS